MLQLHGLSRKFGSFIALEAVDFAVNGGEIVGLLGENGAGKSTLLNIVGGTLTPTGGVLEWDGKPLRLASPREATRQGIGVVHQHFMLVPPFTVAESMALQSPQTGLLYDHKAWEERIRSWAASLNWRIDPAARIDRLSIGERQRVEILKALFAGAASGDDSPSADFPTDTTGARLLLLDEPTANLAPPEVEELFTILRDLREQGRGLVFVSHKLKEVLALCDRVVVLRHGRVVGEGRTADTDAAELAALMVGRELNATTAPLVGDTARTTTEHASAANKPIRLDLEKLSCGRLRDFSLQVNAGEIVGVAGVDGNGQAELAEVLAGLREAESGTLAIDGLVQTGGRRTGIGLIPPDRQSVGLILNFDLAENMALHPDLRAQCRKPGRFDWKAARQRTQELMQRYNVRAPQTAERTLASRLSGGNQQKIVIARALSFPHVVVVAADPTRGLDVGAAAFVHEQLRAAAAAGAAVLLISTDLDEIMSLSDRIGVLYEGRLLPGGSLLPANAPRTTIGELMGGLQPSPVGRDAI